MIARNRAITIGSPSALPTSDKLASLTRIIARALGLSSEELLRSFRTARRTDLHHVSRLRFPEASEIFRKQDVEYLHWRYLENPAEASALWIIASNETLYAAVGSEHVPMTIGNENINAVKLQDVIVRPSHQNIGLAPWMTYQLLNRFPAVFVIGANKNSLSVNRKLFHTLPVLQDMKCWLRGSSVESPRLFGKRATIAFQSMLDRGLRLAHSTRRSVLSVLSQHQIVSYQTVSALLADGPELPTSLLSQRQSGCLIPIRDSIHFQWRYLANRSIDSFAMTLEKNSEVAAYAVYAIKKTASQDRARALLMDWRCQPEVGNFALASLFCAGIEQAYQRGAESVSTLTACDRSLAPLRIAGFSVRGVDDRFFLSEQPTWPDMQTTRWAICYAESDTPDLIPRPDRGAT